MALVIRLAPAAAAGGSRSVDRTERRAVLALAPATFVVRPHRDLATGILRETIRLHGSDMVSPFQANRQIEALLCAWLVPASQ